MAFEYIAHIETNAMHIFMLIDTYQTFNSILINTGYTKLDGAVTQLEILYSFIYVLREYCIYGNYAMHVFMLTDTC